MLNQIFGGPHNYGDVEFWHGPERAGWLMKQGAGDQALRHEAFCPLSGCKPPPPPPPPGRSGRAPSLYGPVKSQRPAFRLFPHADIYPSTGMVRLGGKLPACSHCGGQHDVLNCRGVHKDLAAQVVRAEAGQNLLVQI